MHLYLAQKLVELRCDAEYFFRLAHIDRFKKPANTRLDALQYEHFGIVPRYVEDYIVAIQRKETEDAMQRVSRGD